MADIPIYYERSGLNIETYDQRSAWWAEAAGDDVGFYIELAGETGGPVLELASGTGRVTWPLAEAGFDTVGLDLSGGMLEAAEAKAGNHDEAVRSRIRFVPGDMRDFQLEERFRLVIVPFRAFQNLLTPEDQGACLAGVLHHLEPGGLLAVDIFDPRLEWCGLENRAPTGREDTVHPVTGNKVTVKVVRRENLPLTQTFEEDWRFSEVGPDGTILREEIERLTLRWTYRFEAQYLFERHGFEVVAQYSDFSRSPRAYGKEQVWIVKRPKNVVD